MATLLRPLVDRAVAVAGDRYKSIVNVKRELISLKRIVSLIEGVLSEAEEKQVNNPVIRDWLRELHDICYDARDILDEFDTSIRANRALKQVKSNSLHYFLLGSRRFSTVIPFRFRLAKKIKNLRKRLASMKKDMETAQLLDFVGAGCSTNASKKNRPETGPSPDMHLFVGREVEKENIMEKLLNFKENHVEIVPIWGMGGVGKTTLAQSVYNDERVTEEEYPTKNRRWLCVGEKKFDAKEIISKIADGCAGTNDVEVYHRKLIEKFRGDRFLIVLDDIWDIDVGEWKLFYNPLNRIRKGGLIIITTRTREVITAINTPVADDLRRLSYDDCWHIFQSHAFVDGHPCSDLEKKKCIGKQIVEKLKGLPLAAEVVGRSLLNERDVQVWKNFLEADEWKQSTRDDDVMTALRWSSIMACYNPDAEEFQSVCRVMSGFSDSFYIETRELFSGEKILPRKPPYYPTYGFLLDLFGKYVVQISPFRLFILHHAAIGLVHPSRGISLRFPRYVRTVIDKKPEDCTSATDIADRFKAHRKMEVNMSD